MRGLRDRTAIVTGASEGIGLAIARRLIEEGARVCITGRDATVLHRAVDTLGGPDVVLGITGHVGDDAHRELVVARTVDLFGGVDLLVNNAAIGPVYGTLLELDDETARRMLDVNLLAALAWTRSAVAAGLGAEGGAVVNVGSLTGLRPAPGVGFYGITKAALMHLATTLAVELAPRVRVNSVAPALVRTRFSRRLYADREEDLARSHPLGRLGRPEDVAAAVAYLLSEDAAWVTGETLVLDGGLRAAGGLG